jgi:hypothetical protein
MFHILIKKIKSLYKTDKGGVLVFVALCLSSLFLMLGLAVDSSSGLAQKRKLQMACDMAAKAGAANGNGVTATITSEAQKVFMINTAGMTGITGPTVSVNTATQAVTVAASIVVPNVFMGIGGIPNSAYSATATASMNNDANLAEIAIVYEVSARFADNNFHVNICNALINFINSLPRNVMVSITPIATEFLLDPSTTISGSLFNHLSMTTNDESANPGFYPLSATSYAWNSTNYNTVQNPYYFANGVYATYPSDPGVLTSHLSPATCPGGYSSCSSLMWPTKCPPTNKNTSCSQVYSYISNTSYPILPLTLNKTLIVNYLRGLKAFMAQSDGLFPSFISWGWRTIDPSWNDFWMVNSNATSALRTTGQYPRPYGGKQKSMIFIFKDVPYWNDFVPDVDEYYKNACGNATTVVNGLNHWWMTGYGMVPVPTDYINYVDDITCENKWFKTMDNSLGLALSDSTNYKATVTTAVFQTRILNEVSAKFFRICNNIKAKNIDIYLLANANTATLAPCCNASANAYTIGNSNTSIAAALSAVQTKIMAKIN